MLQLRTQAMGYLGGIEPREIPRKWSCQGKLYIFVNQHKSGMTKNIEFTLTRPLPGYLPGLDPP